MRDLVTLNYSGPCLCEKALVKKTQLRYKCGISQSKDSYIILYIITIIHNKQFIINLSTY